MRLSDIKWSSFEDIKIIDYFIQILFLMQQKECKEGANDVPLLFS